MNTKVDAVKKSGEFNLVIEKSGGIGFMILLVLVVFLAYGEPDVLDAVVEVTRNWILK